MSHELSIENNKIVVEVSEEQRRSQKKSIDGRISSIDTRITSLLAERVKLQAKKQAIIDLEAQLS